MRIVMKVVFLGMLSMFTTVFLITSSVLACVGARPMGMGATFIGVADDANATYWNPAGLTQLEVVEFTYTPTLYDREETCYDDFLSLIIPLRVGRFGEQDLGTLGFSFVNRGKEWIGEREHWYILSYGKSLWEGFSVGINLRYEEHTREYLGFTFKDDLFAVDLSLFWKLDRFSLGILWQDVNRAEIFGEESISILRLGIAFRPDDKTVIALDIYDATGEWDTGVCVGIERWFDLPIWAPEWLGESFALRGGGAYLGHEVPMYTFGWSLKSKNTSLDYVLSYMPGNSGGRFTHQIGLTLRF